MTPTVIFGSGSKVTPFSAFPALTHKLHDWLDEAEVLVVVGYSFRDQHVDAAIYRLASLYPPRVVGANLIEMALTPQLGTLSGVCSKLCLILGPEKCAPR